jgi:dTDP-4-dehydrorhamnose 3,5-epimerase
MEISKTEIEGVFITQLNQLNDSRGHFTRLFCNRNLADVVCDNIVNVNMSSNKYQGTFRGFHMQKEPHSEVKIVKCTKGKILDIALDLRPNSKTYGKTYQIELSPSNNKMLIIPKGCAHAYLTLEDDSDVLYFVTEHYEPLSEISILWSSVKGLNLPIEPLVISDKDQLGTKLFNFHE